MSTVDPLSQSAAAASARGRAAAASTALSADMQTFLKMLTAQMRNQDPLKPLESTDFAVQLATFSGVEQQVRTNQLLEQLYGGSGPGGLGQLAGWVGMEARVPARIAYSGMPITLAPVPAAGADAAILVTFDATGREVRREPAPLSSDPLTWTGLDSAGVALPSGQYTFRLESYARGNLIDTSDVASYARVIEVRTDATGPVIVLDGGVEVAASAVTALRRPS